MNALFVWLWLITTVCFFVAIFRPTAFNRLNKKNYSRKHLVMLFFAVGAVFFIAIGATAAPSTSKPAVKNEVQEKKSVTKVEKVTETKPVVYESKNEDDAGLDKGKTNVKQVGVDGVKSFEYEVTYVDGKQTTKKLISEKLTKEPVPEIIAVGTYVYVAPAAKPVTAQPVSSSVYYVNCTAVRAAGADPIYRGQAGYRAALDRDGDGVGCE